MENKELNIAAILKEKPKGIKFWSDSFGPVEFHSACDENIIVNHHRVSSFLDICGKAYPEGICCIFPSKQMRDWTKFAWKKGDVLVNDKGENPVYLIFESFENDEYTSFKSRYVCILGENNRWLQFDNKTSTDLFRKVSDDAAKAYIEKVEAHYNGKLNLETLEIEKPKQECGFKTFDKVLVRDEYNEIWQPAIFISVAESEKYPYFCNNLSSSAAENYKECIDYEGNEDLAFTNNAF